MVNVREAVEGDVPAIRELFVEAYQGHYAHPEFCQTDALKRVVFDDDVLMLVAEDPESGRVLGTASVILDIGAFGDLIGEFGRLVVHPDGRHRGIGNTLMEARLERVRERLHLAVVENRAVHPYSQKISAKHDFVPVGFLPSKLRFDAREHVALYARAFGGCLELRKNHPRIIPEAYALADQVLEDFGIGGDAIVDDATPAYPAGGEFELEAMSSAGYASLLHFERGRVGRREIFGPAKLHAGLFQLRVSHYRYLLARRDGHLAGGVGFHIDRNEEAARILELVSADDAPVRFLLEEAVRVCLEEGEVKYIEVDVNAHAPAMQRTFLEMGFLPAAYVPAMAFHQVERLDLVRMVKLCVPLDMEGVALHDTTQPVAKLVTDQFREREVLPRIAAAVPSCGLFQGLSDEQAGRLAAFGRLEQFADGEALAHEGVADGRAFLIISGAAEVRVGEGDGGAVGLVEAGGTAGEMSLLGADHPHSATLVASGEVEAAVFEQGEVARLVRGRPDIGVALHRNLAAQLGDKLVQADWDLVAGGED